MSINHEYISVKNFSLLTGLSPAEIEGNFTVEVGGRYLVPRFMATDCSVVSNDAEDFMHIDLPIADPPTRKEEYTTLAVLDIDPADLKRSLLPAMLPGVQDTIPSQVKSRRKSRHKDNQSSRRNPVIPRYELSFLVNPYRRFAARITDLLWQTILLLICALWLLAPLNQSVADTLLTPWSWLLPIVVAPVALTLDAVIYSIIGNTPGKFMLGLKVVSRKMKTLSFSRYFLRNFGLLQYGLAYGILPLSVIYLVKEGIRVGQGFETDYDLAGRTRVGQQPNFATSVALLRIGVTSLVIFVAAAAMSMQIEVRS